MIDLPLGQQFFKPKISSDFWVDISPMTGPIPFQPKINLALTSTTCCVNGNRSDQIMSNKKAVVNQKEVFSLVILVELTFQSCTNLPSYQHSLAFWLLNSCTSGSCQLTRAPSEWKMVRGRTALGKTVNTPKSCCDMWNGHLTCLEFLIFFLLAEDHFQTVDVSII